MKLLRKIVSIILVFVLGFWMAFSGILHGTRTGEMLVQLVQQLPDREDINNLLDGDEQAEGNGDAETPTDPDPDSERPANSNIPMHMQVDYELIEGRIVALTNELRQQQNLSTLETHPMLREVAYMRAGELEAQFSHTRPDGSDAFTVFMEDGINYPYQTAGENLAMGTYYLAEEAMAELLFDGWVASEGHYENMINPAFSEIGVGVHFDGEILYLTQMFGTRR